VTQWDGDGRKDLLLGLVTGKIMLLLNEGTDAAPVFNGFDYLEVGPPGDKSHINLQSRAAPCVTDWNEDGAKDLLVGCNDGHFYLFVNEGTDTAPDFREQVILQRSDGYITVLYGASSPVVHDFDGDGKKDLLSGHVAGNLMFYPNIGSNDDPLYEHSYRVESGSVEFDLVGVGRTRPCLAWWNEDERADLLVGSTYAKVHLLEGWEIFPDAAPETGSPFSLDAPWPQPARGWARIAYALGQEAEASLAVYDTAGRRVALLDSGRREAGRRELSWDGRDDAGRRLPAGVYLVRLDAEERSFTRKLVLLR